MKSRNAARLYGLDPRTGRRLDPGFTAATEADVEQLCRDHGAGDVVIARALTEIDEQKVVGEFDAAIVDLMLDGTSTLDFAARLRQSGTPFVFASGYSDADEIKAAFPDIRLVTKPYSGDDLVEALAAACGRAPA